MLPKKDIQKQLDDQAEALRDAVTDLRREFRHTLQVSIEAAMRTVLEAHPQAPQGQNRHEQNLGEEEDDDLVDDNPFAGLQERQVLPQNQDVMAAQGGENRNWESGFRLELPEFNGSLKPDELLDWIRCDARTIGGYSFQGNGFSLVAASKRTENPSRKGTY
ncbi:hypothetical protein Bca52824_002758 [Brassica carinata]|uniref:Uncharacterized protein n=1 Tax=Brassica carinata TaxID=52824 RepID=A0A8X7WIG3_BRACI|nr:hypothetical protein Bca52824_002758 [Brassica carinata]